MPHNTTVRDGRAEDELAAFEVMRKTMGHDMLWSHHFAVRSHVRSTPGCCFVVAEERIRFGGTRIVGYARSVVRESVWALTEFFVLPAYQKRGIGRALLERCVLHGDSLGANVRLVLGSHHPGANSLYIRRLGCFPRLPMMIVAGPLSRLAPPVQSEYRVVERPVVGVNPASSFEDAAVTLYAEPIVESQSVQCEIDALDFQTLGYSRPEDHAFWRSRMGGRSGASRLFRRRVASTSSAPERYEAVGYAYLGGPSSGPCAALDAEAQPHMLAYVAGLSAAAAEHEAPFEIVQPIEQYWAVPGANEVVLQWLLGCGWNITFHYLLMSTQPFDRLNSYIGYNPLYFL